MAHITDNCTPDCYESCIKYDNLNLSEKTLAGTKFNIDDRKILKVMFCRQDDAIDDLLKKRDKALISQLAEVLQEQFNYINTNIAAIAKDVKDVRDQVITIKRNIGAINRRLDRNDKRMQNFEDRLRKLELQDKLR